MQRLHQRQMRFGAAAGFQRRAGEPRDRAAGSQPVVRHMIVEGDIADVMLCQQPEHRREIVDHMGLEPQLDL